MTESDSKIKVSNGEKTFTIWQSVAKKWLRDPNNKGFEIVETKKATKKKATKKKAVKKNG